MNKLTQQISTNRATYFSSLFSSRCDPTLCQMIDAGGASNDILPVVALLRQPLDVHLKYDTGPSCLHWSRTFENL
jgi:hypothetical protein